MDVQKEDQIEILHLPDPPLGKIASFLCLLDLKSFRLTCTKFDEVSFFREALINLKIVVQAVEQECGATFLRFLDKIQLGRFNPITILQNNFTIDTLEIIAMKLQHVTDLSIDIIYSEQVCKHCIFVKRLQLTSTLQNTNRENDDLLLKQCEFLQTLRYLEELVIQGDENTFNYSRFPARFLVRINEYLRPLKKVTYRRMFLVRDYTVQGDLLCVDYTRTPCWCFQYVYIIGEFCVNLPNQIDSVECYFAEDIHWPSVHSSLKSLSIDGLSLPRVWDDKNYLKLKHITLTQVRFLSMYPPLCKHLYSLHLVDCVHTNVYLKLLRAFSDSVRKLTLEGLDHSKSLSDTMYYRDALIHKMINKIMPEIEVLELINLTVITPQIFDGFNSDALKLVSISNCKNFQNERVQKRYSFEVVIKKGCYCLNEEKRESVIPYDQS